MPEQTIPQNQQHLSIYASIPYACTDEEIKSLVVALLNIRTEDMQGNALAAATN